MESISSYNCGKDSNERTKMWRGKKEKKIIGEDNILFLTAMTKASSSESKMPHWDPKQHSCYNSIINTSCSVHWICWQPLPNTDLEVEPGLVVKSPCHLGVASHACQRSDTNATQQIQWFGCYVNYARRPCHTTLSHSCTVKAWDLVWMWPKVSAAQLDELFN